MKKSIVLIACIIAVSACKKESKNVIGVNEQGQELIINESGDTVVYVPESSEVTDSASSTEAVFKPKVNQAVTKLDDGTYAFKYNLQKGKKYPFVLEVVETKTISDGKQSMKLTSTNTRKVDYLVEDVDANGYTLKVTMAEYGESVKDPGGQSLSYNTSKPKPSDEVAALNWSIYNAVAGQSYTMVINDRGKVLSVNGLDKIVKNVESKLKSQFTAEEQKGFSEFLKQSLNNEVMKLQFEQTMNILPDRNLKLGESWDESDNFNEAGVKGSSKLTKTFSGIDENSAIITFKGTQNMSGSSTQNDVKLTENITGNLTGSVTLDVTDGWLKKVVLDKTETNNRTAEGMGQKETMTETTKTVTKLN